MKNNKLIKQKGFTLIELMVSLAIFSIVVIAGLGAMLAISDANRRVQKTRAVMDNLSLAMESMSRNLRLGSNYICTTYTTSLPNITKTTPSQNCGAGVNSYGNYIGFFDQYMEYSLANEYPSFYYLDKSSGTGVIKYKNYTTAGGAGVAVTSPELDVQDLRFYVTGSAQAERGLKQPRVLMVLSGKTFIGKSQEPVEINIQTTISQRALNN
jgi:prepilin-type N-terminal cleavage/methylation domain-containing protein